MVAVKKGADVNAKGDDGRMPLHLAATGRSGLADGHCSIFLVNSGANVNAKDNSGKTPSDYAQDESIKQFLYFKQNLYVPTNSNLHKAARVGHFQDVIYFLDRGADANAKTFWSGRTPLHEAVVKGHFEVVKYLLSSGADVNAKSNVSETPLHLAAKGGFPEVVKYLLSSGADVNAEVGRKLPLHIAAEKAGLWK